MAANVPEEPVTAIVRDCSRSSTRCTLPQAEATVQDLRSTRRALRAITEKLESEGAGALVGGKTLPDYKP